MNNFDQYARYYDLLYKDKNYEDETKFVLKKLEHFQRFNNITEISSLLELGCGTGRHALHFVKSGITVEGVDRSAEMIQKAEQLFKTVGMPYKNKIKFTKADITSLNLNRTFDTICSLFHVASYQTSDALFHGMIQTAARHIKPNGLFFFDCWYGPAVLTDPPVIRVKHLEDETIQITRIAKPKLYPDENKVDVRYQIFIKDRKTNHITDLSEVHSMRYFFYPEVIHFLRKEGFELLEMGEWLTGTTPTLNSWNVYFLSQSKRSLK